MKFRQALERFANEEICPVRYDLVPGFTSGAYWGWGEARNRIANILKRNPAVIPDDAIHVFRDGNAFCAVRSDFINLQESLAGFGNTASEAVTSLCGRNK